MWNERKENHPGAVLEMEEETHGKSDILAKEVGF